MIKAVDKRGRDRFFQIDNEILEDYTLSPMGLLMYCHLVKWSANGTRESYVSTTSICNRYGKARKTVVAAIEELSGLGLIKKKGRTDRGVHTYEILPVSPGNTKRDADRGETGSVSTGNTSRSPGKHAPDPGETQERNTKKPNKPKKTAPPSDALLFQEEGDRMGHNELIDLCSDTHLALRGERPNIDGKKEGEATRFLINRYERDIIRKKIELLVRKVRTSTSGFYRDCPIVPSALRSRWNYLSDGMPAPAHAPKENTTDGKELARQAEEKMNEILKRKGMMNV